MHNLLILVPTEWALFLFVGAGLAMILGNRALAGCLFGAAIALLILPALLGTLFETLPMWALLVLLASFGFGVLRALSEIAIGKRETGAVIAILVADVIRFTFLAPFKLLAWALRTLTRR